jgi:predicted transposase/invertase (TIGR01784 family)
MAATGIDPTIDFVFKRVCGDEDNALLLVDLLNAVVDFPPGKVVRGVLMLNPFVLRDFVEGKVSVFDVRARDDPGRQFLVEMQRFVRPAFANRLAYYWAGGHAEQLSQGERYELLQPTYTICFVNEPLFPDDAYHHRFRIFDDERGVLLCKDLEIHVIELSKFDVPVEAIRTPLERWCYFFKHGASLDLGALPTTLDFPTIRKAVEVLVRLSQEERERHWAAERLREQHDAAALAASARVAQENLAAGLEQLRIGLERLRVAEERMQAAEERANIAQEGAKAAQEGAKLALQQGIEKGIEKGACIGRIQLLQQLLGQAVTARDELSRLDDADLARQEEALLQQMSGKKQTNGAPPDDKG